MVSFSLVIFFQIFDLRYVYKLLTVDFGTPSYEFTANICMYFIS
jgi:hypothetical protein